jgi:hypothetical protein
MRHQVHVSLFCAACFLAPAALSEPAATCRVWEKVEITLQAEASFANPYTDVEVWVDLEGPGFAKRCFGFWDGGHTFRVRVLATQPGVWTWTSGSRPPTAGLTGREGTFTAAAWSKAETEANPCRRGMIRVSANGHAFVYPDGEPFFLLGDTWWSLPTFRYPWFDDDQRRPMDARAGFKDYVHYRRAQGYNTLAIIAAFPNWANDGEPPRIKMPDGTVLRAAWGQAGTRSAKDMHDEDGNRAFLFPGKVPGYETIFPDLTRINPAYFQNLDRKIDYLNRQGMIPFIEVARRDIGQAWKKYYPWPESYARYIHYIWSRYQANNCLFSPIHFDTPAASITGEDWNSAANSVIDRYGHPPFGTLAGTNSNPSSLVNYGHTDKARWLKFHQVGNRRTHDLYAYLTDIFHTKPPVPGINGEPYYDGMEDAAGGSDQAALYCRSAMYGSVLSGGLGGHIYGAGGWSGGMWSGEVEPESKAPIWDVIQWPSGDQLRHLKTFVLSEGPVYQELVPGRERLTPHASAPGKGNTGWAFCACTAANNLFLLYFEKGCPRATLSGAVPKKPYHASWFNPRNGTWTGTDDILISDSQGTLKLPLFPDGAMRSTTDWALRLKSIDP